MVEDGKPKPTTRALIYGRVSAANERSVGSQVAECDAVCRREGWHVAEVVEDDGIGASRYSRGQRHGWDRAAEVISRNTTPTDGGGPIDVLVTWESSRAQRDLAAYAALRDLCERHNVLWSYGGRTYDLASGDDRLATGLDALLAERESAMISARVRRGTRLSAAAGRPAGRYLYGYRRVYDANTGQMIGQEPDPATAWVVRWIYNAYQAGHGQLRIARALNVTAALLAAAGHDPQVARYGWLWSAQAVRKVLTNVSYRGMRHHNGVTIDAGGWPALIDADTWAATQQLRAARLSTATREPREGTVARLLSGVARCSGCASALTSGSRTAGRARHYRCGRCALSRNMERLDAWVTDVLLERLALPDVADALADSHTLPPEVQAARARLDDIAAERSEAFELWERGELSVTAYARVEATLDQRHRDAQAVAQKATPTGLSVTVPAPGQLRTWWQSELSDEQRREVLRSWVSAVVVHPLGRGRRVYTDADVTEVHWR